jgi:hypothetical protein
MQPKGPPFKDNVYSTSLNINWFMSFL